MSEFLSSDAYLNALIIVPLLLFAVALLVELVAWAWRNYR